MSDSHPAVDRAAARLQAAESALHKVQAQAATLEELSEQLSLSVHMLEGEVAGLARQLRAVSGSGRDDAGGDGSSQPPPAPARSTDVDGARLVALNMALAGDPCEATDRYIAEHFDIPDRQRLLDEVYAAAGS